MRGNYAEDTFTENDVLAALDRAGLKHKNGHRYILTQCPLHDDRNSSAQIYKDDWFVKCHAGCEGGRFHITKAFPELRGNGDHSNGSKLLRRTVRRKEPEVKYADKTAEITAMWESLPPIPDDHELKIGLPAHVLNSHGWRWDKKHDRYLIPYWSRSQKSIPFAQWRNLNGSVRFNFWKDAKPTMYGTWNLDPSNSPLFLVEGTSDAMVLDFCGIPWIAAPSAASGELIKLMGAWCAENDVAIIYAGDSDEAGNKLKDALGSVMSFRKRQPRHPYKDWGEMFEAEGIKSVINWCYAELYPSDPLPFPEIEPGYKKTDQPEGWSEMSDVERVKTIFPGATELRIVDTEKKQLKTEPTKLF